MYMCVMNEWGDIILSLASMSKGEYISRPMQYALYVFFMNG